MTKILFGKLKDETIVSIFTESSSELTDIESEFIQPDISNSREFQLDYTLDADEWFYIEPSSELHDTMIKPYLNYVDSTVDTNPISGDQYKTLISIYLVSKENISDKYKILFNRIFNKYCIIQKKIISFNTSKPELKKESKSVEFTGDVDAYWDGEKLFFKKYSTIKPMFKGIESLYREASSEEVNNFLETDFFVIDEAFKINTIGERARKNIASILDSRQIDFTCARTRKQYNDYAKEYNELNFQIQDDGKFKITKAVDLTHIINILQERLYTSPITREKRVAHNTTSVS